MPRRGQGGRGAGDGAGNPARQKPWKQAAAGLQLPRRPVGRPIRAAAQTNNNRFLTCYELRSAGPPNKMSCLRREILLVVTEAILYVFEWLICCRIEMPVESILLGRDKLNRPQLVLFIPFHRGNAERSPEPEQDRLLKAASLEQLAEDVQFTLEATILLKSIGDRVAAGDDRHPGHDLPTLVSLYRSLLAWMRFGFGGPEFHRE